MEKNKTIFIGYLDTCSYFSSLCTGFRAIGCNAHLLHRGEAVSVGWSPEQLPLVPKYYYRAYKHFWSTRVLPRCSPTRLLATANIVVSQVALLIWMVLRVDAVILKSGESLFANAVDIKILRFFRKTIVFFYVGSDSRPPYLAGLEYGDDELDALYENTQRIYRDLKSVEKLADIVVANPLSSQFHSGVICIAQMIGNTVDLPKLRPGLEYLESHKTEGQRKVFRILHAPSMPALKGSDRIRKAIEDLRGEGFSIDYVEVTGRPHGEVMAELAKCDIVVDELYSDSYAGILAVEACAFGRPVIVCGYGASELSRLLPSEAIVPTIFRHPDRLCDTLRELMVNSQMRKRAEKNAQVYFDGAKPDAVARRFLAVIEGRVPEDWYVDTQDVRYVEGVCGPAEVVAHNVARYVEKFGASALLLDDKRELKTRLLDFASKTCSDKARKTVAVA